MAELVPGGIDKEVVVSRHAPCSTGSARRCGSGRTAPPAVELVDEIDHLDAVITRLRARITIAVTASGTTLTEIFGVGPIVAAMLIGYTGDPTRSPPRAATPPTPAPPPSSSPPAAGSPTACRGAATGGSTTPCTARDHPDPPPPQPRPRLLRPQARRRQDPTRSVRALKRRLSDVVWRHLVADAQRVATADQRARAGHSRNDSVACVTGSHLNTGASAKSLPGPEPHLRPPASAPTGDAPARRGPPRTRP